MTNRIEKIMSIVGQREKKDAFWNLSDLITSKKVEPLTQEEIRSLSLALKQHEKSTWARFMWHIACDSEYSKEIDEFASEIADNEDYDYNRMSALTYMLKHHPEQTDNIIEKYKNDSNPYVLYKVAQLLGLKDESARTDMIIDIYPKADSHELKDAFFLEVYELGTKHHLEKMIKIVEEKPDLVKFYGPIIAKLSGKLRSEGKL